ncbi:MAG: ABC transporter permease, partial [Treponema sp.]|nr:ABC transporter permease [Treponema sp.]
VPLILGGTGLSIAMQTGNLNLGGEGQIYSGAFVATVFSIALAPLGFIGGFLAVLLGMLFAGIVCGISGFCKARWDTNELITSFLLSGALILIVNFLIDGPFNDSETNLQATKKIPGNVALARILLPSNLTVSLWIALLVVLVVHLFLKKTKLGYEFRMAGHNETFARYGGINTKRNIVLSMFFSGALYGLAGSLMVFGNLGRTIKGFSAGLGWDALAAALVAGFYPPAIIPSSLFFAWISSGAKIAMQNSDITFEVAWLAQSVILLLITSIVLRNLFAKKRRARK